MLIDIDVKQNEPIELSFINSKLNQHTESIDHLQQKFTLFSVSIFIVFIFLNIILIKLYS